MKNLINYLPVLGLSALVIFTSCNTDEEVPTFGEGEGKLGIAFVLKNNRINSSNGRVENSNLAH
jgi:hypothetical protein